MARPSLAFFGVMRSMTDHGSGRRRRWWFMFMPTAAAASMSPSTWNALAVWFRWMLIPATTFWRKGTGPPGRSSWRFAGHICAAASMNSTNRPAHQSRARPWIGSASFMRSRKRSAASRPSTGRSFVIAKADRSLMTSSHGLRNSTNASQPRASLLKRSRMRWEGFTLFLDDGRIELDTNVLVHSNDGRRRDLVGIHLCRLAA